MSKLLKAVYKYLNKPAHKSHIAAWLGESKDIYELENKMKLLKYKGYWI